jgi:mannosyltransferase OCH1-like enzyme
METQKNCPIPKKIFQTWEVKENEMTEEMQKIVNTWKQFNPDYEYYFFDDNEVYKFMVLHYGEASEEINALNWLEPGAYRADLFRYCILHLQGGIYADCKQMWRTDLDSILSTGEDYYYVKDSENNLDDTINKINNKCKEKNFELIEYNKNTRIVNFKCKCGILNNRRYKHFIKKEYNGCNTCTRENPISTFNNIYGYNGK